LAALKHDKHGVLCELEYSVSCAWAYKEQTWVFHK